LLLKNCRAAVLDERTVIKRVDILITGRKIAKIGKQLKAEEAEVIDCSKVVVIPGFVNAHAHTPLLFLRGAADDLEFSSWLKTVWQKEQRLNRQEVLRFASLASIELLKQGTVCVVDTYLFWDAIAEARKLLGPITYTGPGLRLQPRRELPDAGWLEACRQGYVRPILSIHSLYNINNISEAKELLAQVPADVPVTLHLAETRQEVAEIKRRYGCYPLELLEREGLLRGRKWLLVHCGWITSREVELLRKHKNSVLVVHCPSSTMKLATYGFLPLKELLQAGIRVALGTDSPASCGSLSMPLEARTALLLYRHSYWTAELTAQEVFKMITSTFFEFMNIPAGKIKEGYFAHLLLIDDVFPYLHPFSSRRLVSHLVLNPFYRIKKVII